MRVKAQVRFTALKEEQIKFCISVSVINANRVFLYYEDGRPLPRPSPRGGKGGSAAASFSVQAAKEEPTVLFGNSPFYPAIFRWLLQFSRKVHWQFASLGAVTASDAGGGCFFCSRRGKRSYRTHIVFPRSALYEKRVICSTQYGFSAKEVGSGVVET